MKIEDKLFMNIPKSEKKIKNSKNNAYCLALKLYQSLQYKKAKKKTISEILFKFDNQNDKFNSEMQSKIKTCCDKLKKDLEKWKKERISTSNLDRLNEIPKILEYNVKSIKAEFLFEQTLYKQLKFDSNNLRHYGHYDINQNPYFQNKIELENKRTMNFFEPHTFSNGMNPLTMSPRGDQEINLFRNSKSISTWLIKICRILNDSFCKQVFFATIRHLSLLLIRIDYFNLLIVR